MYVFLHQDVQKLSAYEISSTLDDSVTASCEKQGNICEIAGKNILVYSDRKEQIFDDVLPDLTSKVLLLMGLHPSHYEVKTVLQNIVTCGIGSSMKSYFDSTKGI